MDPQEIINRITAAEDGAEEDGLDIDPEEPDDIQDDARPEEEGGGGSRYTDDQVEQWRQVAENPAAAMRAAQERNEEAARWRQEAEERERRAEQILEQQKRLLESVSGVSSSLDGETLKRVLSGFSGQPGGYDPAPDLAELDPATAALWQRMERRLKDHEAAINNMAGTYATGMLRDSAHKAMQGDATFQGYDPETMSDFESQVLAEVYKKGQPSYENYEQRVREAAQSVRERVTKMEKAATQKYLASLNRKKDVERHGSVSSRGPKASRQAGSAPVKSRFERQPGESSTAMRDRIRSILVETIRAPDGGED